MQAEEPATLCSRSMRHQFQVRECKVLAHGHHSCFQPFKLVLAEAGPATDATICIEPLGAMPMVARRKPLSKRN